jgi:predicted KAP-like P-loop ATPase
MILDILIKNKYKNKIIKEIGNEIKNFSKGFAEEVVSQNKFLKPFYEGSKKAIGGTTENKEKELTKNYLSFIDLKNQIQKNLKNKMNDSVYIFIDDLDRCNTNFVIKLIEITKHLFNIENIVIIYMLDLKIINHSIVKYYNLLEDNNANETYLSKIIDYVHNLEEVDKTTYLLKRYNLS